MVAKIQSNSLTTKSFNSTPDVSFAEWLLRGGNKDLSNYEAMRLYSETMPLFNAVDMRSRLFSMLPVRVRDKKTGVYIKDHQSLELLESPNADVTGNEFLQSLCSFYDITGDAFIIATGRFNKPPIEIMAHSPQKITFGAGGRFGVLPVPSYIEALNSITGANRFKAEEAPSGIRFRESDDRELWHIRSFNPMRSQLNFWGMSRARPVWLEAQQYSEGNKNNLSQLERGARLSMVWINNRGEELTETQWQRIQEEAEKYRGSQNAGGNPVLDGMDVREMQSTNRDMEYQKLQTDMLSRISVQYGIPLPFLLMQSMTLNNLETASLQIYDNAIIPLTKVIYPELTRFLMPRYRGSENLEFTFNQHDIPALQGRLLEMAERQTRIGVNTDDELREIIGYSELSEGGDVIYKPANMIPAGTDIDAETEKAFAARFVDSMRNSVGADGERKYSDDDIVTIARRRGIVAEIPPGDD